MAAMRMNRETGLMSFPTYSTKMMEPVNGALQNNYSTTQICTTYYKEVVYKILHCQI